MMAINDAGLAIQSKPKTVMAAESWIGLLTSRARAYRRPVVLSSALKHEASI